MPKARPSVGPSEETNGRNGAGTYLEPETSPEPRAESDETRRQLAVLIMLGNTADAEALYFAIPGSTVTGWNYLLRTLEPARRYVLDGDPVWTHTVLVTEYEPVMTPQGDCAEDALPREQRNKAREAEKQKMERNGPST